MPSLNEAQIKDSRVRFKDASSSVFKPSGPSFRPLIGTKLVLTIVWSAWGVL